MKRDLLTLSCARVSARPSKGSRPPPPAPVIPLPLDVALAAVKGLVPCVAVDLAVPGATMPDEPATVPPAVPLALRLSALRSINEITLPSAELPLISPTSRSYRAAAISRANRLVVAKSSGSTTPPFPWAKLLANDTSTSICFINAVSSDDA